MATTRSRLPWAAAAVALVLGGCGARLETRTFCYTLADAPVPGADASGTLDTDLAYDLGASLPSIARPGVSTSLTLEELDLAPAASSAVKDLSGLEALDLSVLPPDGSTLPEEPLIRYARPAGAHPTELRATANRAVDLQPYLTDGVVDFHVKATGTLPRGAWSADARACFLLDVNVQ